jgi:hypothetical protein
MGPDPATGILSSSTWERARFTYQHWRAQVEKATPSHIRQRASSFFYSCKKCSLPSMRTHFTFSFRWKQRLPYLPYEAAPLPYEAAHLPCLHSDGARSCGRVETICITSSCLIHGRLVRTAQGHSSLTLRCGAAVRSRCAAAVRSRCAAALRKGIPLFGAFTWNT